MEKVKVGQVRVFTTRYLKDLVFIVKEVSRDRMIGRYTGVAANSRRAKASVSDCQSWEIYVEENSRLYFGDAIVAGWAEYRAQLAQQPRNS